MGAEDNPKVLLIGALVHADVPTTFGGTTILLEDFINYLREIDYPFLVVPTNKYVGGRWARWMSLGYTILACVQKIRLADVVILNGAVRSTFVLGPFLYSLARLSGRKFVFRKFGGSYHTDLLQLPSCLRYLAEITFHRADLFVVETKEILNSLKDRGVQNLWQHPNCRRRSLAKRDLADFSGRFVFLGRMTATKGVRDILAALELLNRKDISVDFYGPLDAGVQATDFNTAYSSYCGVVDPSQVAEVLKDYDALILPSYFIGEGQPGIVIEAKAVGIPTIGTRWRGLSELIVDGVDGWLIEPRDPQHLAQVLESIEPKDYRERCRAALLSFEQYESGAVYQSYLARIRELTNTRREA